MSMLMSLMLLKPHGAPMPHVPSSGGESAAGFLAAAILIPIFLVMGALFLVIVGSMWKIFSKAGQPGWHSLVPFLNCLTLGTIVGKPGWWLLVPGLNIYAGFVFAFELAKAFGQSAGFGLGLIFLPIIFYPMLAFGSSTYHGAAATTPQGYAPGYGQPIPPYVAPYAQQQPGQPPPQGGYGPGGYGPPPGA